jgi:hypothetical protein
MVFCTKCGAKLTEDVNFCPKCGTRAKAKVEVTSDDPVEALRQAFSTAGEHMEKVFSQAEEEIRRSFSKSEREKVKREEFEVKGSELVDKVKALIHEGNVRRIIVKDHEGKTLMEFPLTIGVIGAVLAPILAAVGAIAALAMKYTLVVERKE